MVLESEQNDQQQPSQMNGANSDSELELRRRTDNESSSNGPARKLRRHIRKLSGDIEYVVKHTNEIATNVYQSGKRYIKMLSIDKVSLWQNDNPHILNWHRPVINDSYQCFMTLFNLHNETINIWSHLIGAIIMIYLWIYYLLTFEAVFEASSLPMHTFFFFSIFCMLSSASFHLMYCQSERLKKVLNKLDYIGVILMIFGSSAPVHYFYFYCNPVPRVFYVVLNLISTIIISRAVTDDHFQDPGANCKRITVFLAFGFSSAIPIIHYALIDNGMDHAKDTQFLRMICMAAFYSIGAIFYALYFPERFAPGNFDLFLNSHQILHICVVVAALIHYYTLKYFATKYASHVCK